MVKTRTRKKKITLDDLRNLWMEVNNGKEPPEDESIWFLDPLVAFLFAKYKKGSPYSLELEKLFYGNVKAIYCYVDWMVRDLGLERPEHLHNYMITKSIEFGAGSGERDKEWVDLYFQKAIKLRK